MKKTKATKGKAANPGLLLDTDLAYKQRLKEPSKREYGEVGPLLAEMFGISPKANAVSKTFSFDPFKLTAPDGTLIWTMDKIKLTYVRATDNNTGIVTCFITLSMFQTASGWALIKGGNFHILSQTQEEGLLDDWDTGPLDTNCHYNHALKTYSKNFRPDWYELAKVATIGVSAGTWGRCH